MIKTNCFASGKNGRCEVTTYKGCVRCPFFKTSKQFREDFKRSAKMLKDNGNFGTALKAYPVFGEMYDKIGG